MNSQYLEDRRQITLRRQARQAEPGKPINIVIGEHTVTLTRQPMEWGHTYSDGTKGEQKFKSKYKVEHNGIHRGWIIGQNGWGTSWVLHRLTINNEKIHYWDIGGPRSLSTVVKRDITSQGREALAREVPQLVATGKLGTVAEQLEQARLESEHRREEKLRQEQALQESRRQRELERQKHHEILADRHNTLQQLLQRQVLTNYETEIVNQIMRELEAQISRLEMETTGKSLALTPKG